MGRAHLHPPRIPRDEWVDHPSYPGQVLLLRSHQSFLATSRALLDAARTGDDSGRVGLYFGMWISAMRSHEAYEERKLYPYLAHFHGLETAPLCEGHQALHRAESEVRRALGGETDLHAALLEHDRILRAHLEMEENAVVPLLLEMPGDEFSRVISQPIERLLPQSSA